MRIESIEPSLELPRLEQVQFAFEIPVYVVGMDLVLREGAVDIHLGDVHLQQLADEGCEVLDEIEAPNSRPSGPSRRGCFDRLCRSREQSILFDI